MITLTEQARLDILLATYKLTLELRKQEEQRGKENNGKPLQS